MICVRPETELAELLRLSFFESSYMMFEDSETSVGWRWQMVLLFTDLMGLRFDTQENKDESAELCYRHLYGA